MQVREKEEQWFIETRDGFLVSVAACIGVLVYLCVVCAVCICAKYRDSVRYE